MQIAIIKTGASGDVVRTTTLLHLFKNDEIYWITSTYNMLLLPHQLPNLKIYTLEQIKELIEKNIIFDLVISLDDEYECAKLASILKCKELYGTYINIHNKITYTENSTIWNDMGLLSRFGIEKANELKIANREPVQATWFRMLGYKFCGEPYLINRCETFQKCFTSEQSTIAIEKRTGSRWPSKMWNKYDELAEILNNEGHEVKFLQQRNSLTEYIEDINNCSLLITGDSWAMHLALTLKKSCVALFLITNPYEIYDYGVLYKIISPLWDKAFYTREHILEIIESIKIENVINNVQLTISKEQLIKVTI